MRGVLIFDHLNDILFTKCNEKFAKHVEKLAKNQGLISEKDNNDSYELSANVIMQLFSPIVTSQQMMASQFGNSYTSINCEDGTNIVFDYSMGYTFLYISNDDIIFMKRSLGICVTIAGHVCGPDISLLKTSQEKSSLVSSLMDSWRILYKCEQSILTETVEQLCVNADLGSSTLKILQDAADKLKASEYPNVHLLVLVENKFLSLYSSKNSQDLNASDILLTVLLCHVAKVSNKSLKINDDPDVILVQRQNNTDNEEITSIGGKLSNPTTTDISNLFNDSDDSTNNDCLSENKLYSQLLLLGCEQSRTANAIHIFNLFEGINLITITEVTNLMTSSGIYDSFYYLNIINSLQLQNDIDELRPAFDNLDLSIKKTIDGIKKNRGNVGNDVDMCQRRMQVKWEFFRKKYVDLLKSWDQESVLQIESNMNGFIITMKELFKLTCFNKNFLKHGIDIVLTVSQLVKKKFNAFNDFLKVKAIKNFTLDSRTSLTINKYLEEFPGLVHFIYINRTTNRLIAPTLDFTNPETLALTTKKIWTMVEQSRNHLQEGHFSIMWKDCTFNYAYFLWFEDNSGSSLKCKTYINHMIKSFPLPGIMCGNYYKKLAQTCFPKISKNKIRIYELYCVHLGLATSSCVLEHSRRLAATIWEITGLSKIPTEIM